MQIFKSTQKTVTIEATMSDNVLNTLREL
jgi:hypothetical protein